MSASGCWKKNMYQLRLICARLVTKAMPTALPGGTADMTTLDHRSGRCAAAMLVMIEPQSCPMITARESPPSAPCNPITSSADAAVWNLPSAGTALGAYPRRKGATAR
ncbi:unannotated protein [freshwater metagenome]|uniref:Unannotated protein n=1 Tax=freshwater metagenome TaxID=449393 RepID=A0A6J6GA17_9ZZZZ